MTFSESAEFTVVISSSPILEMYTKYSLDAERRTRANSPPPSQ